MRRVCAGFASVVSIVFAAVSCTDSTAPKDGVGLRLTVQLAGAATDDTLGIRVWYARAGGGESIQQVNLPAQPSRFAVPPGTSTHSVSMKISSCFADNARAMPTGCQFNVEVTLYGPDGLALSTQTQPAGVSQAGETVDVPPIVLQQAAISASTQMVSFTAHSQSASIPAATVVAISSATSAPLGTLSAAIAYNPSATDYLAATIASDSASSASISIRPTKTELSPGVHAATVTVTSSRAGVAPTSIAVSYTVTPPLTPVTLQFCPNTKPIWFAYQSTGDAWTQVAPGADNSFTFPVTPTAGIALVTYTKSGDPDLFPSYYTLRIYYASVTELQALAQQCAPSLYGTKTLYGSVAGVTAPDAVSVVRMGGASGYVGDGGRFTLPYVPDGPSDLVVSRVRYVPTGDTGVYAHAANSFIIRRGLNLASGSEIPLLDFGSSEAFAAAGIPFTLTGVGSDHIGFNVNLVTAGGTSAIETEGNGVGATALATAVPEAHLALGDLHEIGALAEATDRQSLRSVVVYARSPSGLSVAFRSLLNTPTVTVDRSAPYVQPRVQVAAQADYPLLMEFSLDGAGHGFRIDIVATAAYFGSTPTVWDIQVPDLTGVSGFSKGWGLYAGGEIFWAVSSYIGTRDVLLRRDVTDGSAYYDAWREGILWPQ